VEYAWLAIGLPLLGSIINGIFGRFLPKKVVGWVACSAVGASFIVSLLVFLKMLGLAEDGRHIVSTLYTWLDSGGFRADMAILIDALSVTMMLVVTGVGLLIHIYSTGYMADDEGFSRFFAYMNLFVGSMLLLVMAENFVLLFVGWELVGICSYLLISFWYEKPSAAAAGRKAFITTRIGDVGFTLGVVLIVTTVGTASYDAVFGRIIGVGSGTAAAIALLLFAGAVGKSAQLPLHVWLPDAMEGPTPVSALIHAATMVTAGVYLIVRAAPIFAQAPWVLALAAGIGAATALFAATAALVENDIKRVLAYSTISQIGLMFLAVGAGAFAAGMFHLVTHAFFKSLLFLGAGSVMHALAGNTDLRKMGGLAKKMRATYAVMVIGALAMAGIFPLSGFFSKEAVFAGVFEAPFFGRVMYAAGMAVSVLTAFYIFRLIYKAFHGEARMDEESWQHVHESPKSMIIPMLLLALGAICIGWIGLPSQIGETAIAGRNVFEEFLRGSVSAAVFGREAISQWWMVAAALGAGLLGIFAAWCCFVRFKGITGVLVRKFAGVYAMLVSVFWIDWAYERIFVRAGKALAVFVAQKVDVGIIDGAVNGIAGCVGSVSVMLSRVQTGYLRSYALAILAGAVVVVGYALFILK